NAVINWFDDEENIEKKLNAYNEMMGVIDVSSSKNLYLGISKSLHEFTIEKYYTINDINYHDTLKEGRPKDNWYFECIADSKDYLLNVDIDKLYNRKRVWLNYKVSRDGVDYGVICTGLEFSQVVEKLFSEYDSKGVRGLIIDEHGYIHMDSSLLGDENFLYALDDPQLIQEIAHPTLLEAVKEYTKPMDNFYNSDSVTTVLELSDKDYQYATIAPIASTTWSVITLYNSSALFALSNLAPVFVLIPITFILFILLMNAALSGLMLKPFYELVKSIEQVNKNFNERVYGLDREDEIGELAHTIQNMKDSLIDALSKVHYDALTSIYNRRYFDENLHKSISSLSRSNG
ncbi:MAG: HAMP domain-containing protein, partial [Anaerotignaceae bacterium]